MTTQLQSGLIAKAIVSALSAGLTAAVTALQDGNIEQWEWATIAGAVLASGGLVFFVTNAPSGIRAYAKAIVSLLTVAAGAVGTALVDGQGITTNEWMTVLLALAAAYAVSSTPNAAVSDGQTLADPYTGPDGGGAHFEGAV